VTAAGESGGAPPYWPWAQVIRSCVRDRAPEELRADLGNGGAHLAQITPELRETLPDLAAPPPPRAGSEDSRFYLFDAAAVFLRNVAKRAPVVLVLDDVHAADGPSLLLLRFVADELREAAILVLATFRAAEARQVPAVHHLLGELARGDDPAPRRTGRGTGDSPHREDGVEEMAQTLCEGAGRETKPMGMRIQCA